MRNNWPISIWTGAAIGAVAAAALAWLVHRGVQAFMFSVRDLADGGRFAGAGWLLVGVGAVLTSVVVGARFHPLTSAIPAAWFLLLFGPSLLGVVGTPDWYPGWMSSYFLQTGSAAVYIVTGVLIAATLQSAVRGPHVRPRWF